MSREVLAPPLQRMGNNRCYRVNLVHDYFGGPPATQGKQIEHSSEEQGYKEPDLYAEDDDDADEDGACTVEELPNSMFKLTMHVPNAFYGGLVGFKGSTKRRIESETRTEIYIPRSREGAGKSAEDVSIKGKSRSSVCAARRKINLLTSSLRKRMRPTHFLAAPLNMGEIKEKFTDLQQAILKENFPGIDEQLFQHSECIHLTLGTYVLLDDTERAKAVEILQSCRPFLANLKTPFAIKVHGLEIMNDDPSSVRVLYANVTALDLQQFADFTLRQFRSSGLLVDNHNQQRDNVKLHMTVMNNRYRKDQDPKSANSFDAREILKQFSDYHFGTAQCSEVQICVLGSSRVNGEKSFYKVTGELKF